MRGVNWVGDAVMTVPALRELRCLLPSAHLTLATRPWAEGIFAGADFIDDFLVTRNSSSSPAAVFREAREWRARRFDLAVLLPNSFAPALVAALARVPLRVGYATQGRAPLLTERIRVPAWRGQRHEVFYYLNLVAELEQRLYQTSTVDTREPRTELGVTDARLRGADSGFVGRCRRIETPCTELRDHVAAGAGSGEWEPRHERCLRHVRRRQQQRDSVRAAASLAARPGQASRHRQRAADGTQAAIEPELADRDDGRERVGVDLTGRGEEP